MKNWCFWTVVLEKTLENSLDSKEIKPVNAKGSQPWLFIGRNDAEAEALEKWCWERLRARGEGDDRGWGGWMASPTQRTLIWVNSRSWWKTGRPGVLWSMESQRVRHNWATELNWTDGLYEDYISLLLALLRLGLPPTLLLVYLVSFSWPPKANSSYCWLSHALMFHFWLSRPVVMLANKLGRWAIPGKWTPDWCHCGLPDWAKCGYLSQQMFKKCPLGVYG